MSTMKHTPGPWHTYQVSRSTIQIRNSDENILAATAEYGRHAGCPHDPRTIAANAHLIAAAPDLLEALTALTATARTFRNVPVSEQQWTTIDDDALDVAFAAIAKATTE